VSRRPANHERRTTKPTVSRTRIAIATWPRLDQDEWSLHHETELVKAALLYADSVELVSPGNHMLRSLEAYFGGPSDNLLELVNAVRDEDLARMGVADPGRLRASMEWARTVDRSALDPEGQDVLRAFEEQVAERAAETSRGILQMREQAGVAEIDEAVARGLVTFNDKITFAETNGVVQGVMREVERYLRDHSKLVLLDNDLADLASAMIKEGRLHPSPRAVANAGEAAVATGLIARLPAFPSAPMDELLDLRKDLADPLTRYRRAAEDLRAHLLSGPFDEQFPADVDAIWRTRVEPELVNIKEAMADHGLVREVLKHIGSDPKALLADAQELAGLTVLFGAMADIKSALITGAATAFKVGANALRLGLARQDDLKPTKRSDMFYLYELQRRL